MYDYLNSSGTVVPDTQTLYDEVSGEWRTAFGESLVVTPDTPQGVMITAEVSARVGVANNNAAVANQINPNLAGGVFLDAICALLGLERYPALPTTIDNVVFSGVYGTLVPVGSRARTTAGDIFVTREPLVIGAAGTVTGAMYAEETGPVGVPVGALNTMVDTVLGWEGVLNPVVGVMGQNQESDIALRERRRVTLARQTISTREAQLSALNELDGVTSAVFRENVSAAGAVVDTISMVAHSVWACVDGGTDLDVATTLLRQKTDGAAWNGATVVNVTDPFSGQIYPVKFDRPAKIPVLVVVTVRRGNDPSNPVVTIPAAVTAWANGQMEGEGGLGIGVSVSPYEISAAINRTNPQYTVTNITLARSSGGAPTTSVLSIGMKERAVIAEQYVTVVIV